MGFFFAEACKDVVWNEKNIKCMRKGTVDGKPVQVLVDTGSDHRIVAAKVVKRAKLDDTEKVPVLCVLFLSYSSS